MRITFLDLFGLDSRHNLGMDGQSLFADEDGLRVITIPRRISGAHDQRCEAVAATYRFDRGSLRRCAEFLDSVADGKAERVVALNEELLMPAAELRVDLGLEGDLPGEVAPFRDKILMKRQVSAHGVRVPEFSVYTPEAARRLMAKFGKVVAKPRMKAGSVGVQFLSTYEQIAEFESNDLADFDYEVEQFIDGDLYHIDSVVADGVIKASTAGHSMDPTITYRTAESRCWDIEVPPGALLDQLKIFNHQVVSAFPKFSGVTHHEVFRTEAGELFFCEIAKRWGGGGTRPGFHHRTGLDIVKETLLPQLGRGPSMPSTPTNDITGHAMIYASHRRLGELPDLSDPWILSSQIRARPGERFAKARAWGQPAAMVSVAGRTVREVEERLQSAEDTFRSCLLPEVRGGL